MDTTFGRLHASVKIMNVCGWLAHTTFGRLQASVKITNVSGLCGWLTHTTHVWSHTSMTITNVIGIGPVAVVPVPTHGGCRRHLARGRLHLHTVRLVLLALLALLALVEA